MRPNDSEGPVEVESAPSPTPSPSSTGEGGSTLLMLAVIGMLPMLCFVAVFCRLRDMTPPDVTPPDVTPHDVGGDVNPCSAQGNDRCTAIEAATCTPAATDGATAGTTAILVCPSVLAADRVGAGGAVPAASSFVAGGDYAPRSGFHAISGNAGQPLPTAVAVP